MDLDFLLAVIGLGSGPLCQVLAGAHATGIEAPLLLSGSLLHLSPHKTA